jgi:molecular chaperone HscB
MKRANVDVGNHSMFKGDDYFIMFNLEQKFDIDQKLLQENYLKLQQICHPDKQINKTNSERIFLLKYASKLNDAYETLKDDKRRAEYLLFLNGIIINQEEGDNVKPDPIMLSEILEISEDPENFAFTDIQEELWQNFKDSYNKKDLQAAAQQIIKLHYLSKIAKK